MPSSSATSPVRAQTPQAETDHDRPFNLSLDLPGTSFLPVGLEEHGQDAHATKRTSQHPYVRPETTLEQFK